MGEVNRGERRGWDIAAVTLFLVMASISLTLPERLPGSRWIVAGLALGILGIYTVARRYLGIEGDIAAPVPMASALIQAGLITLLAIGTAIEPNMLLMQTIVLPLIWMTSRSTAQSVIVTLANGLVLGTAYAARSGFERDTVTAAVVSVGLSAAFSIALGLWITRIAAWGTERHRLLAELTAAQASLEAASREAGAVQARARVARDVHDTVAQSLASIVMLAERARRDRPSPLLETLEEAARDALTEARTLIALDAPAAPTEHSLSEALGRLGARLARETGMGVRVDAATADVPRELQVVLLRCAQEALANVRTHSGASAATVVLSADDPITLRVGDDGRGLRGVTIDDAPGFGLRGMRDRVSLVGGTLTVEDAPEGGAVLTVRLPRPPAEEAQ